MVWSGEGTISRRSQPVNKPGGKVTPPQEGQGKQALSGVVRSMGKTMEVQLGRLSDQEFLLKLGKMIGAPCRSPSKKEGCQVFRRQEERLRKTFYFRKRERLRTKALSRDPAPCIRREEPKRKPGFKDAPGKPPDRLAWEGESDLILFCYLLAIGLQKKYYIFV